MSTTLNNEHSAADTIDTDDAWDDDSNSDEESTTPADPAPDQSNDTDDASPATVVDDDQFAGVTGDPAVLQALEALEDARDRLADAEGAATVAGAQADDLLADTDAKEWQRLAAVETLAKAERAVTRARARADRAATAYLHAQYDATIARAAAEAIDSEQEAAPQLYFATVDDFVREFLVDHYARAIGTKKGPGVTIWAARWWKSREAVSRLTALWRAWEHLRLDPATGMSVWWLDHFDRHMRVLMDGEHGPFVELVKENPEGQPRTLTALPYEAPPAGMFQPVDEPSEPAEPTGPSQQDQQPAQPDEEVTTDE